MKPSLLRKGGWFTLISGKQFWPFDPRPEEIEITDIAHALSHICRWGGHCKRFYSVGQHSVMVSRLGNTIEEKRAGLLHDASEAYLGDMIRPVKHSMPEFQKAEYALEVVIAERFGTEFPFPDRVTEADNIMLATEAVALMHPSAIQSPLIQEKADRSIAIDHWDSGEALHRFLAEYKRLFIDYKEKESGDGEE